MLIEMVRSMFSHDYEDHSEEVTKVDFYGNDGVCLFKYFVQNDDPQRSFVWSILALNFVCFLFISLSYLLIGGISRTSSKSLTRTENRQILQRNNRMNKKIAIIIVTDFLCWIPFIVICVLHTADVLDATPWYSVFSMIILPLNSVINPLLYDDVVTGVMRRLLRVVLTRVSSFSVYQSVRRRFSSIPTESIQLECIKKKEENTVASATNKTVSENVERGRAYNRNFQPKCYLRKRGNEEKNRGLMIGRATESQRERS